MLECAGCVGTKTRATSTSCHDARVAFSYNSEPMEITRKFLNLATDTQSPKDYVCVSSKTNVIWKKVYCLILFRLNTDNLKQVSPVPHIYLSIPYKQRIDSQKQ